MMRKAKLIIIMLIVLFLAIGCDVSYKPAVEDSSLENPVVLKYAQFSIPLTDAVDAAIQKYNETNSDNIKIELLKIPRSKYNDTINMLLTSGDGPDIFEARPAWLFSYIYKSWLYELTDVIDEEFLSSFPQWAVKTALNARLNNNFYSIPSIQVTNRLIYNKDLFKRAGLNPESPPETLSELEAYAKKITQSGIGDRIYGFALPANDIWSGFILPMEAASYYSGMYFFNHSTGFYNMSIYQPWLKTFIGMKENGSMFPGEMTMKEDLALLQFSEGNVGMMLAQSWAPALLQELFEAKCNWGVAMPPLINKDCNGKAGIDASGWQVVNNKSANVEKSTVFWRYLYSSEYNKELYSKGCLIPAVNGIDTDNSIKSDIQHFENFLPGDSDSVYPLSPLNIDEYSRSNVIMSIFNGSESIERGLTNESYRLNMLLDKYKIANIVRIEDYIIPNDATPIP